MKLHTQNKRGAHAIIISLLGFSLFCGDPIPVEEMGNAKFEITRAESVNAEKYAPEPYEAAKTALFDAHNLITDKKLAEAKEKAIEAQNLAKEAFNISAPLLAQATREEATTILGEAERAFAEQFAKTEYDNAVNLIASGDEKMAAEDFYGAFQDFESAREEAIKARNLAEAQAEVLAREADAVEEMIVEAEQYGARESAPDMMSRAEENLATARESLKTLYLKDAYQSLEIARNDVQQASDAAKKDWAARKRMEATGAVEEAESELVNLKSQLEDAKLKAVLANNTEAQDTLRTAEETLSAAQGALANSGDLLEAGEFNDSYSQSEEAIRLSAIVKDQVPQLLVLLSDPNAGSSRGVTPPVDTPRDTPLAEGWKTYTVRLIPQRRDCLWRIAEYDYIYNDPLKWTRIYKANKGQIKNPDLIFPGQVFDVPPATGSMEKPPAQPKQTPVHVPENPTPPAPKGEDNSAGQGEMGNTPNQETPADSEAPQEEEGSESEKIAPADNI